MATCSRITQLHFIKRVDAILSSNFQVHNLYCLISNVHIEFISAGLSVLPSEPSYCVGFFFLFSNCEFYPFHEYSLPEFTRSFVFLLTLCMLTMAYNICI